MKIGNALMQQKLDAVRKVIAALESRGMTDYQIAATLQVVDRQVRDWRTGRHCPMKALPTLHAALHAAENGGPVPPLGIKSNGAAPVVLSAPDAPQPATPIGPAATPEPAPTTVGADLDALASMLLDTIDDTRLLAEVARRMNR